MPFVPVAARSSPVAAEARRGNSCPAAAAGSSRPVEAAVRNSPAAVSGSGHRSSRGWHQARPGELAVGPAEERTRRHRTAVVVRLDGPRRSVSQWTSWWCMEREERTLLSIVCIKDKQREV